MTLTSLIAALQAKLAAHGDVDVVCEIADGDPVTFGVHTAPWAREAGEAVRVYLDVTAEPGSVGD